MGCSHCMEDSTVAGQHMTRETFEAALDLTERVEAKAYAAGAPRHLLISGGECSEHPDFLAYFERALERRFAVTIITNGMWLGDEALRNAIVPRALAVQVTNDPRFYPKAPPRIEMPRLLYVDALTTLVPLGRLGRKSGPHPLPVKGSPSSFNVRSLTRSLGDIGEAVAMIRLRAMLGKSGHCAPSIGWDGGMYAGETINCFRIGDVRSTNLELSRAVCEMKCNACGLVDGLPDTHKAAIGELE